MPGAKGTKLPRNVHARLKKTAVSAYSICLEYEAELEKGEKAEKDVERNLIYCRIIGYLFHHYPTDRALSTIASEVLSCKDREMFLVLGRMYFDCFVRALKPDKKRVPTLSSHPSRPSFDNLADMIKAAMEEAPQNHATAKRKALARDGFRCVVTGQYDYESLEQSSELRQKAGDVFAVHTQCTHIFDELTNANIEPSFSTEDYCVTSNAWAIMKRFGYESLPEDLNGPLVHRLENVMTLCYDVHVKFNQLLLWFVETSEPHTYKLEAARTYALSGLPEYVTFTTPDEDKLPLPSPTYLKLHATCCQVARLSGAAEYVEEFYRDMENTQVLSHDGSTARLLEEALLCASSRPALFQTDTA